MDNLWILNMFDDVFFCAPTLSVMIIWVCPYMVPSSSFGVHEQTHIFDDPLLFLRVAMHKRMVEQKQSKTILPKKIIH